MTRELVEMEILRGACKEGAIAASIEPGNVGDARLALSSWLAGNNWDAGLWEKFSIMMPTRSGGWREVRWDGRPS